MKTKPDNDIDFDPVSDPSQDDYSKKFNEITGSHENKAFDDQVEAGNDDGFRYTGDQDRDSLFDAENEGDSTDSGTAEPEKSSLHGAVSKKGDSNWKTNLKSKKNGITGKINSLSGGKKKIVLAVTGSAGVGAIVMLLLFLIPFASFLSLEQLTTVLKTYRFANFHYSSYRRMSQYTVQESLDTRPITVRGKVSAKLAKYNPVKSMNNLKEDGTMEFVYKDGKSRWTRRPTKTLEKIRINTDEISVPKDGTRNFFKQRKFMKEVDSALAESELLAGKSRYFRTKVANEIFKSKDIKLNRWLLKGRKIKTLTDAVRSLYDAIRPKKSIPQSIPDADDSAKAFDEGLDPALDTVKTIDDMPEAIADHTAASIRENRIASVAKKASLAALVGTLYCAAKDYVRSQQDIAQAKGLAAQKMALKQESALAQAKYGDTTATAIDQEALMNTDFEESRAWQKAVGVDPVVLAGKEPDLDKSDAPIEDTTSYVRKVFNAIIGAVEGGLFLSSFNFFSVIPGAQDAFESLILNICKGVNSTAGQFAIAFAEVLATVILAVVSAGTAAAAKGAGTAATEVAVQLTFREAVRKLGARAVLGIATKEVFKSVAKMSATQLVIAFVVDKYFGTNSPALDTGEARTAKQDMGMKLYANDMAIASGGRQLTGTESAQVKKYNRDTQLASLHKKPLWYRMASLSNPYSPASRFAVTYPKSEESLVNKIRGFAFKSVNPLFALSSASSGMSTALMPSDVAFAETDEKSDINEYMFPTIGFSVPELDKMLDDKFWPRENAEWMEQGNRVSKLNEKYGECFGMLAPGQALVNKHDGKCSAGNLSSDEAMHYRLYRMDGGYASDSDSDRFDYDQGILGEALDLQDVSASTSGSGGDSDDPTDPVDPGEITSDSSGTPCFAGTEDLGVRDDAYSKGQRIKIRLCALGSISGTSEESTGVVPGANGRALVSSIASESWQKLGEAAKSAGIPLTAGSSWRTMAHQERLCREDDKCPNGDYNDVAKPGTSNHQAGTAIDISQIFQTVGSPSSGRTCSNPQTANIPTYTWVAANARSFGIKNYANEAWHWGTSEAC